MTKALLIMAHGSRSETANDEFRALVEKVAESAHARGQEYAAVIPCFLELAHPSLIEAIQQLEHQPVESVQLYPLFFNKGKHVGKDIPSQIEEARERFPELHLEQLDYFGNAPGLADLVLTHLSIF
ncbi:MAG: CbiX/SirB N-terminal domain-containing protein [Pseudomonadota bacterium]|nr:CbiX/SirB N-terminal domain-containing protein [Pseudomonadota bacterium]